MSGFDYDTEVSFSSPAPGYWGSRDISVDDWSNFRWQMKNRVQSLEETERYLQLSQEERAGILLTGTKLASAVTPHFFNLIEADNPDCPIRRQIIPQVAETFDDKTEMADPCGEDSHMPVPGLVHRYPDRVLLLVIDRCASYCRYCTRSRVVSGVANSTWRPSSRLPSNTWRIRPRFAMSFFQGATRSCYRTTGASGSFPG